MFDAAVHRATEDSVIVENGIIRPRTSEILSLLSADYTPDCYQKLASAMAECLTANSVLLLEIRQKRFELWTSQISSLTDVVWRCPGSSLIVPG